MITKKKIIQDIGSSAYSLYWANLVGLIFTDIAVETAAGVSVWPVLSATILGGAVLYMPTLLLKAALESNQLLSETLDIAINAAYILGSAALGAMILGFAVQPFVFCAGVGIIAEACIASVFDFYGKPALETVVGVDRYGLFGVGSRAKEELTASNATSAARVSI